MRRKITEGLSPTVLNIKDDSHKHAKHAAMQALGGDPKETHFEVEVVSAAFEGKPLDEFKAGLHALALKTKTPAEAAK
eukprot:tig00020601_g11718.t1